MKKRLVSSIAWKTALIFLVLSFAFPPASFSLKPTYTEVKAAFIIKMLHFIDWPDEGRWEAGNPLRICVMGEEDVADILTRLGDQKTVKDRPLEVLSFTGTDLPGTCHLAYIGSRHKSNLEHILDATSRLNILSMGDTTGYAERGVIINFFVKNSRVRFQVNLQAARQNNFTISSKLLKLASIVGAGEGGAE